VTEELRSPGVGGEAIQTSAMAEKLLPAGGTKGNTMIEYDPQSLRSPSKSGNYV
jgi:hypothetical protein